MSASAEDRAVVHELVRKLTREERDALIRLVADLSGKTLSQTANLLGIERSAVSRALGRDAAYG